jgi:1-acyl-sn-glycerol-3-phosphate acyltransferase
MEGLEQIYLPTAAAPSLVNALAAQRVADTFPPTMRLNVADAAFSSASRTPRERKPQARARDFTGINRAIFLGGRLIARFIVFCTMRVDQLRPELAEGLHGGYVLALTHLGNLDPFCSTALIRRPIRWMVRREFYRFPPCAGFLRSVGSIRVNRQGIPVRAIRDAIAVAREGQIVGICPEGGRTCGADAAVNGGPIKRGVCSIAIRAAVPIVPCVILGTEDLNRVGPWLPAKRIRLRVAYGQPIIPPTGKSTRASRDALRDQILAAYRSLHDELRRSLGQSRNA